MRLINSSDGPACKECGDWIEIHDGKRVCKSGCPQILNEEEAEKLINDYVRSDWSATRMEGELTLPQLDSLEDGPIDGYDY